VTHVKNKTDKASSRHDMYMYFPADWSKGFIVALHKKGILMMLVTIEVLLCYPLLVKYLQKS